MPVWVWFYDWSKSCVTLYHVYLNHRINICFSDATCIECNAGKYSTGGNSTCKICTQCKHQVGYHGGSSNHNMHLSHSSCSKTQDTGKSQWQLPSWIYSRIFWFKYVINMLHMEVEMLVLDHVDVLHRLIMIAPVFLLLILIVSA